MRDDDIAFAKRLADAAGAAIRPYFRAEFGLETKADTSPVTLADRAAEAAIRAILESERPGDGIIGEEYGTTRESAARQWVIDPIDGTRSFIAGRAIFGTLIALMEDGWPILGLIDQPIQNERWVGAVGHPTSFNGVPVRTRACPSVVSAHLASTGPQYFDEAQNHRFGHVVKQVRTTSWGGDCYNYGLLASGHIDIVVEAGLKIHDFAALIPVVEGAGGLMCDWAGEPLNAASEGHVIALGDPARLEDVLEGLACHH